MVLITVAQTVTLLSARAVAARLHLLQLQLQRRLKLQLQPHLQNQPLFLVTVFAGCTVERRVQAPPSDRAARIKATVDRRQLIEDRAAIRRLRLVLDSQISDYNTDSQMLRR